LGQKKREKIGQGRSGEKTRPRVFFKGKGPELIVASRSGFKRQVNGRIKLRQIIGGGGKKFCHHEEENCGIEREVFKGPSKGT